MGMTHDGVYTGGSTEGGTRYYGGRVKIPLTEEQERRQQQLDKHQLEMIEYERRRATTDARRDQLDRWEHRVRGRRLGERPSD